MADEPYHKLYNPFGPTPAPAPTTLTTRMRELMEEATPGPWRAMREGNQYVDCKKLTPTLVAASRVHGVQRPWNPYAATQFGLTPEHHEAVRFKDGDADLIVHLVNNAPTIIRLLEAGDSVEGSLKEVMEWITNWSPAFADDEEWPEAEHRARQALATLRAAREGAR